MLITVAPTEAQSTLTEPWLASLLAMDSTIPWVIWHDADQEVGPLKKASEGRPWQWLTKNPLWHQDTIAPWIKAWPAAAQHNQWQSLQAMGLLHDTYLSVGLVSSELIWVSPVSLAGQGVAPGWDFSWLLGIRSTMEAMVFTQQPATEDNAPVRQQQGLEVIWVDVDHLPRLNAMYWHHYAQAVADQALPSPSGICQQIAQAMPGQVHWLLFSTITLSDPDLCVCSYEELPHD